LQAFYRKYYQPDNALLVVAGKFETAKALQLIAQKFGPIPKPARSLATGNLLFDTYTRDPEQDGERSITVRRVGDQQLVMALYKIPAGTHADFAAIEVLNRIITQTPGGRLHKALVQSGKAASASGNAFQLKEPGMLLAAATVQMEQSLEDATT